MEINGSTLTGDTFFKVSPVYSETRDGFHLITSITAFAHPYEFKEYLKSFITHKIRVPIIENHINTSGSRWHSIYYSSHYSDKYKPKSIMETLYSNYGSDFMPIDCDEFKRKALAKIEEKYVESKESRTDPESPSGITEPILSPTFEPEERRDTSVIPLATPDPITSPEDKSKSDGIPLATPVV